MKKFRFFGILFLMITSLVTLCSCTGEMGPQGPRGEQGIQGEPGQPGKDGTALLTGNGEPSTDLGVVGDSYIDLDTWDFYVKSENGWVVSGNIKGEKGDSARVDYDGTEGLEFYPINDTECAVSAGNAKLLKEIVIPSVYNGMNVTQIVYEGFAGCTNLIRITLPDSLKKLDEAAFDNCINLKDVYYKGTIENWCNIISEDSFSTPMQYAKNFHMLNKEGKWFEVKEIVIPDTVKAINFGVFYGFNNVTELTIPSSVENIGNYAFYNCTSLENIYYDGTIEDWCNISFDYSGLSASSSNPMENAKNLYFLDDNGPIEHNNKNYKLLENLVIPDGITTIPDYVFYGIDSLTSVVIPNSVTSIGKNVLKDCTSLTSVTIPFVGAKLDGTSNTFFGYLFGASSSNSNSGYVPTSLKEVIITGGTTLSNWAFYNCSNIEKIVLPTTLNSIGQNVFNNCKSLKSIIIPESITSIDYNAFGGCSSLTSIEIPSSVTYIASSIFYNCSNLESITIPKLEGALTMDYFGASSSDDGSTCPASLKEVIITGGITLGSNAFYNCENIERIILPDTLINIGGYAFYNCIGLETIVIPSSVANIDWKAFEGCSNLTIYFEGNNETTDCKENWNSSNRPVYWAGEWEYDSNGNPVPLS